MTFKSRNKCILCLQLIDGQNDREEIHEGKFSRIAHTRCQKIAQKRNSILKGRKYLSDNETEFIKNIIIRFYRLALNEKVKYWKCKAGWKIYRERWDYPSNQELML